MNIARMIIRRVKYKARYPHCFVSPCANIVENVCLEDGVIVQDGCYLDKVRAEQHVAIYDKAMLVDVEIGRFSYIAPNAMMSMTKIGSFCSIGPYLICGYGDHPTDWISTSPVFFSTGQQCGVSFTEKGHYEERKPIVIGHDVWIGARVFIRDGVRIGNGAIIAAGAVVVKDVPDYAIAGGVPAKPLRYRFSEDVVAKLIKIEWWKWPEDKLRMAQPFFVRGDLDSFFSWVEKYPN